MTKMMSCFFFVGENLNFPAQLNLIWIPFEFDSIPCDFSFNLIFIRSRKKKSASDRALVSYDEC